MNRDDRLLHDLRVRAATPIDLAMQPIQYPPASSADIAATESELGFALPPLLKRIYLEVANGGVGPDYGLFGVRGGHLAELLHAGQTMAGSYTELLQTSSWPERLLPISDHGCAIWSCLDCRVDDGAVVTSVETSLWDPGFTLRTWLRAWLDGVSLANEMFEPGPTRVGTNPFTREPMTFVGRGKPKGPPWPRTQ